MNMSYKRKNTTDGRGQDLGLRFRAVRGGAAPRIATTGRGCGEREGPGPRRREGDADGHGDLREQSVLALSRQFAAIAGPGEILHTATGYG